MATLGGALGAAYLSACSFFPIDAMHEQTSGDVSAAPASCDTAADCGVDADECTDVSCDKGQCFVHERAEPDPSVVGLADACQAWVCEAGQLRLVPDDDNIDDDNVFCTRETCDGGIPNKGFVPHGTKCSGEEQPDICDGAGSCALPLCENSVVDQSNGETDRDCGGGNCPPCTAGKNCLKNDDCVNLLWCLPDDLDGTSCQPDAAKTPLPA